MPVVPSVEAALLATAADLAARMQTTFTATETAAAAVVIRDVSAAMRDLSAMSLETAVDDTIVLDGHGDPVVLLPQWPVTIVDSVTVTSYDYAGVPTVTTLAEHVDFEWSTAGVLTATSWKASNVGGCGHNLWGSRPFSTRPVWPDRPRCITVIYDHGPDDEMWEILRAICLEASARVMTNPDGSVRETIGSYTIDRGPAAAGVGLLNDVEMSTLRSLRGVKVA
jgi:hypothetical protein